MDLTYFNKKDIVIIGCGKMGSALLSGWIDSGIDLKNIMVIEPNPSPWLRKKNVRLNKELPKKPVLVLIAIKPQMMSTVIPKLKAFGSSNTVFVSIAAGTSISYFSKILGDKTPIVRAMPNTPSSIGKGITAIIPNSYVKKSQLKEVEALLSSVGKTVLLNSEQDLDAVTAVSGSGPAYVFHLIETMASAGEARGLGAELSMSLAKATVSGAGALAEISELEPSALRVNVTSPGGTTEAALKILMDKKIGLESLLEKAVKAATKRSRELKELDDE